MRLLDLFSGIGGFSLGLERAGFQTVAFCEIEPYCRRVLAKHWPGVPCYDDVRALTAARLAADGVISEGEGESERVLDRHSPSEPTGPLRRIHQGPHAQPRGVCRIDAICGGFPCQDISTAGKGAGIDGERSGLWREYARLVRELRPRWVLIENVPALRTRGADRVLDDLDAAGYAARPLVVGAVHAGAPHKRARVWIVANRHGEGEHAGAVNAEVAGIRPAMADAQGDGRQQAGRDRAGDSATHQGGARDWVGDARSTMADPDIARLALGAGLRGDAREERSATIQGGRQEDQGRPLDDALRGRHGGEDGEVRTGRDGVIGAGWWLSEPDVGRVAHGVPQRVDRLRALGNAVVPQVVEAIGRAVMQAAQ